MQWIQVRKSEPLKMYYKYSLQEDVGFSCVNFAKRGRGDKKSYRLKQLHPQQPRALSVEEVNDIRKLLKYVPPVYHDFYTRLELNTTDNVTRVCDDELLGQSDDEATRDTDVSASPPIDQAAVTNSMPESRKCRPSSKTSN